MIGPTIKRVDVAVCAYPGVGFKCDVLLIRKLEATKRFLKGRTVNYCSHPKLDTEVAFIKKFPRTPNWCPARQEKGDNDASAE